MEYFNGTDPMKREFDFVQENFMTKIRDEFIPKKRNKAFELSFAEAGLEQETYNTVIEVSAIVIIVWCWCLFLQLSL